VINPCRIPVLSALVVTVMVCVTAVWAQEFLEGLEDVPLTPGLSVVADTGMAFDTPGGRIVETYATGALDRGRVVGFYAETLPALGWMALSEVRYLRDGEVLALDLFGVDGDLLVRFTLAPE